MKFQPKKLNEQVIVITGASSGIGLVTARMAARHGARVVLAARNEQALKALAQEIEQAAGQALPVVADVTKPQDIRRLAQAAIERFGGFDTWVNNAAVTIFGRLEEVTLEDQRRLFETNFWGVVHGSLAAVEHLRRHGGVLINIGSTLSERAFPLQGMYGASKHAVKAFTETLRMELEKDRAPVHVTLIKPSAIATPYPQHAKNYLPQEPTSPPPIYAPELVAQTILRCAEHPMRDVFVGGAGKAIASVGRYAPRLMDKIMEWQLFDLQKTNHLAHNGPHDSLYAPGQDLQERGKYDRRIVEHSLFTRAALHPLATTAIVLGAGIAAAALWASLSRPHPPARRSVPPRRPTSAPPRSPP